MIKPTFLRRVAIAALLSGSCFSAAAAPPAPPVSYGVEEEQEMQGQRCLRNGGHFEILNSLS